MSRPTRFSYLSLALLAGLVALFAHSLTEAGWVAGNATYVSGLWLGLVCGALLAVSRFSGRAALGCSFLLSGVAAAESVGHIWLSFSARGSAPPAEVIWLMHLRLVALFDRLSGWGIALLRGESVSDTGLFVFLLSLVVWNASAWLAWCVGRWQKTWEGLLPFGVLLTFNIHLSGQSFTTLWLYSAGALALAALTAFTRQHGDWEKRRVDYPDGLGYAWSGSAVAVIFAVSLMAGVAPVVGMREGWRALSDYARLARLRTVDTAERLFSEVNPPESSNPVALVRTTQMDVIGAPPAQGQVTVMWVLISDPAPPPPQANLLAPRHYWRSAIFAAYTGVGWEPPQFPVLYQSPEFPQAPPGRYALRQHFEIVAPHAETLFAANAPASASDNVQIAYTPLDGSAVVRGTAFSYDVISWATDVTEEQLRSAPQRYPPEIVTAYLQLPAGLPQRVRDLAARLTADAATPYDKALRLRDYLRTAYPYMLDVPPPPAGRDAVDYFLFDAPGGFCSYYASAMAVMLRTQGVPARVAAGYTLGEYDPARGAYRVPSGAAHAWVEVYFSDHGWVEFEPTAAQPAFNYVAGTAPPRPAAPAEPSPLRADRIIPEWMLALALLLGLVGAAWWSGRRSEPGARTPRGQAQSLYRRIRRSLVRVGLGASPSVTPNEFLAAASPTLSGFPTLRTALAQATALYLLATFSPRVPPDTETRAARRLWNSAQSDWQLLWLRREFADLKRRIARLLPPQARRSS